MKNSEKLVWKLIDRVPKKNSKNYKMNYLRMKISRTTKILLILTQHFLTAITHLF